MDISDLIPKNKKPKIVKKNNASKEFKRIISEQVELFSNRQSLITITNLEYSSDNKYVDILFTVIPRSEENKALNFLTRNKDEIRRNCQKIMRGKNLPYFLFKIDNGELNRQKIDRLLFEN